MSNASPHADTALPTAPGGKDAAPATEGAISPPPLERPSRQPPPPPKRGLSRRLAALNPYAILFGPTFQMEVRSAGRRRGTYILRFLYALGLLAIAVLAFIGLRDELAGRSAVHRLQTLQEFAPIITGVIVWFQFIALALAAPIMTAPAVCDERRAGTLGALLTTPLTSAQIAFGKLTSRLVQLLILSLLATPLLLAVRVFGGLQAETIIAATAISASTAILAAALALAYSIRHRRATTAALFALFTLALAQFAPLTIAGIVYYYTSYAIDPYSGAGGKFPIGLVASCSPGSLSIVTAESFSGAIPVGISTRTVWLSNTAYNLLLASAVTLLASVALRRAMLHEAGADGAAERHAASRRAKPRAAAAATPEPAAESAPELRLRARERTVGDRPVLWREVRQSTFGSRAAMWVAAALAVAALGLLYAFAGIDEEGLHPTLAIIGTGAALITSVFLTTGGITTEREARTWDVLLTTPLTAREIILGKFLGALRRQWFIPAVVFAHFLISVAAGQVHPVFLLHFLLILSGPLLFLTATGSLYSLLFRRGTVAAVCNLATAFTLWIGLWFGVVFLLEIFRFDALLEMIGIDRLARVGASVNPIAMAFIAIDGGFIGGFRGARPTAYELPAKTYPLGTFTLIASGVWLGYTLAAALALWIAVSLFPRLGGRAWSGSQERARLIAQAGRVLLALPFVLLAAGFGYSLRGPLGALLGGLAALALLTAMAVKDERRARAA